MDQKCSLPSSAGWRTLLTDNVKMAHNVRDKIHNKRFSGVVSLLLMVIIMLLMIFLLFHF